MGKRKDVLRAFQLEISEAMRRNKHGYKTMLKRILAKVKWDIPRNQQEKTVEDLVVRRWREQE